MSDAGLEHSNRPRLVGRITEPDELPLAGTPGAGPFMGLFAKTSGRRVIGRMQNSGR
jgi:hypothetical protein